MGDAMMRTTISAAMAGITLTTLSAASASEEPILYADFRGAAIVTISDGDMKASAYIDGQLGPDPQPDALTVTRISHDLATLQSANVPVSNSVAGPPSAIAITSDQTTAFVTESFGTRPEDGQTFRDLPIGTKLTAIDISDLSAPKVIAAVDIGHRPEGVSVHPEDGLVVATLHPVDGRQLAFVRYADGQLGTVQHVIVPGVEPSERISHAEWHPSGDFLALTLVNSAEIMFVRVIQDGPVISVEPWGNKVLTSKYPFMGRFTPDGRHFLTGNLYWGSDVPGIWAEAVGGDVTSVRFASEETSGGDGTPEVRHYLVGRAAASKDPEGVAVSPDGRWVVSVNLETSYAPTTDRRLTLYSSVSLLRLDPVTGHLSHADTVRYDGILPESATFDASGRFVALVTFDNHDPSVDPAMAASLDFFRITDDGKLVMLRRSMPLPRGAHSMQLIR